jgi:NADH-quinone oxidoreductase subunit E
MRTVKELISNHGQLSLENLIPILQDVQDENGYVSTESMEEISAGVGVPVSRVFGVATFYRQFRFAPLGEHVIEVCRGTACHVKGSLSIADHLKRILKLSSDMNSPDGKFSLITVACLGACSIAPVIKINGEFHGHLNIQKLDSLIDELSGNDRDGGDK